MKTPEYVIWDWNGTLFNDVAVCIAVQNQMLRERNMQTIDSMDHYHRVFTFPIIQYYQNLGYDLEAERFEDICSCYVALYERDMVRCGLYDGALPLMRQLQERGTRQAIISAASSESLQKQMAGKGLDGLLEAAVGIQDDLARSKTENAKAYVDALDVDPQQILFVGDTLHDAEVARECGCGAVLIADGHQGEDSLLEAGVPVFRTLRQLAQALGLCV